MEENPEVSFMLTKLKAVLIKNEETGKVLEKSKRDLKESKDRCNEALKDQYLATVKKLEEAYNESRTQVELEHDKLREDQEEKEKTIHRCSYSLMPEILQLTGCKGDESCLEKCKDILASNDEAIEMCDANSNIVFNFIPNSKLRKLKLGFLQLCDNLPSDFKLSLLSPMNGIAIGNQISCGIEGELTKENLKHLKFCIQRETVVISAEMHMSQDKTITFSFCPDAAGMYSIMACLFGQHITNSPLSLEVTTTLMENSTTTFSPEKKVVDCDSSTPSPSLSRSSNKKLADDSHRDAEATDEVGSSGDKNNAHNVMWRVGDGCIARWEEDQVWYNAEIKQLQSDGRVSVTFVDYGNSDVVTRFVHDFSEIPITETYDENVTPIGNEDKTQDELQVKDEERKEKNNDEPKEMEVKRIIEVNTKGDNLVKNSFSVGDVCVARWEEDGVWYNGKVEMVNNDGTYKINFSDYGNSVVVCLPFIVTIAANIPKEVPREEIDGNVNTVVLTMVKVPNQVETEATFIPRVGDICVARWDDDGVWYNAKVEAANMDGSFMVNFIDYGNTETVKLPFIVQSSSNIPEGISKENIDENVQSQDEEIDQKQILPVGGEENRKKITDEASNESFSFSAGDVCVAKWSEDDVWYNAVITSVQSNGSCAVMFSDYGNTATIESKNIVCNAKAIPEDTTDDYIDENVKNVISGLKDEGASSLPKDSLSKEESQEIASALFLVGESCVARWDQDMVWYNGKITDVNKDGSFVVNFVDYGNTEVVYLPFIVKDGSKIGDSVLRDQIDENVDTKIRDTKPHLEHETSENVLQTKVELSATTFSVGDSCVARWTEDLVWYNGKITDINVDNSFMVHFVDYGNTECVKIPFIVHKASDIPESVTKDEIDENVLRGKERRDVPDETSKKTQVIDKNSERMTKGREKSTPPVPRPLKEIASAVDESLKSSVKVDETTEGKSLEVETNKWQPGDICLAQWSDDSIWYNAVVESRNSNGLYTVTFYDYGNEEEVHPDFMVHDHVELLMRGEHSIVDENVKVDIVQVQSYEEIAKCSSSKTSVEEQVDKECWLVGEECIAMWSEDDVWYNARIEEIREGGAFAVKFVDYGNSEVVRRPFIVKQVSQISQKDPVLDENVEPDSKLSSKTEVDVAKNTSDKSHSHSPSSQKVKSPEAEMIKSLLTPEQLRIMNGTSVITSLNILKCVTEMPDGTRQLPVRKMLQINQDVKEPIGITILQNKNIVIASTGDDSVKIFSQSGKLVTLVQSGRLFKRPSDMVTLSTGEFVVRDDVCLQLFTEEGAFIRNLGQNQIDRCYGVTEDEKGRIVTINGVRPSNVSKPGAKGRGGLTDVGETDIFYIDQKSGAVVKRIELVDIVQDKTKSKCRFLNYFRGTVYIVDLGLDCVYTLNTDGNHADMFGSSGSGPAQFSDPAGLVLDDYGNMIVADSRNHRLQIFNSQNQFVGIVKVDAPLRRPSGIYLDKKYGELYVLNYWGNSMVKYRIG